MPWFKVDDGFAFHRKAVKAGNTAIGLWVRAGSWSAQQLTDGYIPEEMLPLLGAALEDAGALINAGLWKLEDAGWSFVGWEQYQPTKADVEDERAKARERQKEWRKNRRNSGSNAVTDAVTNAVTDVDSHGGSNSAPTLPDPSLPSSTSLTLVDGSETSEKTPRAKKATRIPEPWIVDEAMRDWALERSMQPQWVMKHTERFVNYWKGVGGQRGTKIDWRATWQNWLLKAQDDAPAASPVSRNGYAGDDVRARFQ